jgi:hypothetical protein
MKKSENNFFFEKFLLVLYFLYFCTFKIEAIHNKDYSVVKTLKAGRNARLFFKNTLFFLGEVRFFVNFVTFLDCFSLFIEQKNGVLELKKRHFFFAF